MIRFACPECAATFNLDSSKAGKRSRCPTCAAEFVIPKGDEPANAPAATDTVEVNPCPKCQTRLSVSATDVGKDVACPYCQTVFLAQTESRRNTYSMSQRPVAEMERPSRRRARDEDEDDDRPSRRHRRDDDDDEDDDRPRRKSRRRRQTEESKRITAGILALFLGGWGIHKFYLGYTNAGVIQLVLSFVTCGASGFIALAEGIIYLTKSDEDFVETYQIGTKEWF